jgi:hypothetical protein
MSEDVPRKNTRREKASDETKKKNPIHHLTSQLFVLLWLVDIESEQYLRKSQRSTRCRRAESTSCQTVNFGERIRFARNTRQAYLCSNQFDVWNRFVLLFIGGTSRRRPIKTKWLGVVVVVELRISTSWSNPSKTRHTL